MHIVPQKLVGVVVLSDGPFSESGPEGGCVALLAGGGGGPQLQLWRGAELHEHELRRALADAYARSQMQPQGKNSSNSVQSLTDLCSGITVVIFASDQYFRNNYQIFSITGDLNSVEIMALDMKASGSFGILLLIAAVNVARSPEMKYAIGKKKFIIFNFVFMELHNLSQCNNFF